MASSTVKQMISFTSIVYREQHIKSPK